MSDDRHASEPLNRQGSYSTERYEPIALKAIFFGLLFFWASKRKVTRAAAADRNARRAGGPVAEAPQKRDQRYRDNLKPRRWIPASAGMTSQKAKAATPRHDTKYRLAPAPKNAHH